MLICKAVGLRILKLCREQNISVYKLSLLSAVPSSTLTSILHGKSKNPGIVTIKKLCDGLEISILEFFDDPLFENLEQEVQ